VLEVETGWEWVALEANGCVPLAPALFSRRLDVVEPQGTPQVCERFYTPATSDLNCSMH
jgi:hypothetical protein